MTSHNAVEKPMDNLGALSSKYKTIGGYGEKEQSNMTSPKDEKNPFENFEKKYLKPIFTKQQGEDLDLTYSIQQEKKEEDTGRRMELVEH